MTINLLDTADWSVAITVRDAATRTVVDLTGSLLKVQFRSVFGGPVLGEASTATGRITITDAVNGKATIKIPAASRVIGAITSPTQITGDLLRRPGPAADDPIEWSGRITATVQPGSTSWA